jgi:alkylation response protein AidB-like acyl-CoA dehydrogenase
VHPARLPRQVGAPYRPGMDLRDSPAQARFRAELREWLAATLAGYDRRPRPGRWDLAVVREWTVALHAAGYAGLTWPREYGGQGRSVDFQAIFLEETADADAPEHIGVIGLGVVGPTILAHGTAAQRAQHLPRILSGTTVFCQGFSEPEAGSDLAAVRTRAVRDGDDFVVTGHKLWSSYAHLADACLVLARTDPAGERHSGLTCLLLDMHSPGVAVRPQRQLTGEAGFNEIVLDGVRVPAAQVLGDVDDGWRVAMTGLANERGTLGFTLVARFAVALRRVIATARATGQAGDPVVRDRIAGLAVDLAGLRWTSYRALSTIRAGGTPGPESSYLKLSWSVGNQRLTALALDLLGPDAVLDAAGGFWHGYWQYQQLRSLGNSIEGGTSEIQRNIVAERILGLPRSR